MLIILLFIQDIGKTLPLPSQMRLENITIQFRMQGRKAEIYFVVILQNLNYLVIGLGIDGNSMRDLISISMAAINKYSAASSRL